MVCSRTAMQDAIWCNWYMSVGATCSAHRSKSWEEMQGVLKAADIHGAREPTTCKKEQSESYLWTLPGAFSTCGIVPVGMLISWVHSLKPAIGKRLYFGQRQFAIHNRLARLCRLLYLDKHESRSNSALHHLLPGLISQEFIILFLGTTNSVIACHWKTLCVKLCEKRV